MSTTPVSSREIYLTLLAAAAAANSRSTLRYAHEVARSADGLFKEYQKRFPDGNDKYVKPACKCS